MANISPHSKVIIIYLAPAYREALTQEHSSAPAGNPYEDEVEANLRALVRLPSGEPFFSASIPVYLCRSISECTSRLEALGPGKTNPIITAVLVHICHGTAIWPLPPQFNLQDVTSEIIKQSCYNYVIPIALVSAASDTDIAMDKMYRNQGAADVLLSPLNHGRLQRLRTMLFNTCRDLSNSPVQVFTATRRDVVPVRNMVQDLAGRICNPDHVPTVIDPSGINFAPDRQASIVAALSSWSFSAHDLSDDELLFGASLMLQHVLKTPALKELRMTNDHVTSFLMATRRVYNESVPYHNFRHACDVMQATFFFLVQIGTIPPFAEKSKSPSLLPSFVPAASLLDPFHALTLLVAAIGHDAGHPGLSNKFLMVTGSPLAQLYNDKSVLESFHCAAYSQILQRYWPETVGDTVMRKLMVSAILATDMEFHYSYITRLRTFNEALMVNGNSLDSMDDQCLKDYRDLVCCLLLKCADICNVGRKFDVAKQWADLLDTELSGQGDVEKELEIPTLLPPGSPTRGDLLKMARFQTGFMDFIAIPFFEAVAEILPNLQFIVDEIATNKALWKSVEQDATSRIKARASVEHFNERIGEELTSGTRKFSGVSSHVGMPTDFQGNVPSAQATDATGSRRSSGGYQELSTPQPQSLLLSSDQLQLGASHNAKPSLSLATDVAMGIHPAHRTGAFQSSAAPSSQSGPDNQEVSPIPPKYDDVGLDNNPELHVSEHEIFPDAIITSAPDGCDELREITAEDYGAEKSTRLGRLWTKVSTNKLRRRLTRSSGSRP